jgi:hypothetical protein
LSNPSNRNCLQYIVLPAPEGPDKSKIFGPMPWKGRLIPGINELLYTVVVRSTI